MTGRETAENANVALSLKKVNLELQNSFTGIQLICSRCGTVAGNANVCMFSEKAKSCIIYKIVPQEY